MYIAPKMSLDETRETAVHIRILLDVKVGKPIPAYEFYEEMEKKAQRKGKAFYFIGEKEHMGHTLGDCNPRTGLITIREDQHQDAKNGGVDGSFTMIHELSHNLLHTGMPLPRVQPNQIIPAEECVEAQADALTCELQMDIAWIIKNISKASVSTIADKFKLPIAEVRKHMKRLFDNGDLGAIQLDLAFCDK